MTIPIKRYFLLFLMVCLIATAGHSQSSKSLPRGIPEEEGVSSRDIMTFLDSAAVLKGLELHSFMFLRHGKVIAEASWNPYKPTLVHTLNSCSKVYTSTAMGFALSERLLSLDDKVISFFPNELPDTITPMLARLTVRDLLTMSAGLATEPNWIRASGNWAKGWLSSRIAYSPGTKFQYSSLGSYMVGAILIKATGKDLLEYLKPRLFDPLGIEGIDWDRDSQGNSTGGSGMRVKIEDMAKLGQLYLQNGKWNGKQILPAEWVKDATSYHIDQAPDAVPEVKAKSDWMQGYGYHFWRCRNNCFRGDGAGGQFIIVMPEKDVVIAIQADIGDMQEELNLVWKCLLPAIKDSKLSANPTTALLKKRLEAGALPLAPKKDNPALISMVSGKNYSFNPNEMHLESFSLSFIGDLCYAKMKMNGKDFKLFFGEGKWVKGETALPRTNNLQPTKTTGGGYVPQADGSLKFREDGIMLQKVVGSYGWASGNTLELVLRYNESTSGIKIVCRFDGAKMTVGSQYIQDSKLACQVTGELK